MTICFENETDQELDFDYENILEKVRNMQPKLKTQPSPFTKNVQNML